MLLSKHKNIKSIWSRWYVDYIYIYIYIYIWKSLRCFWCFCRPKKKYILCWFLICTRITEPISAVMWSKAWVCGRSLVRIPPSVRLSVFCDCCVLSGKSLCDGPISRTEGTYRMWCIWVWWRYLENEETLCHLGLPSGEKHSLLSYIFQRVT